jgi:hypothetical protein
MDTLELIGELRTALSTRSGDAVWELVSLVDSSLDIDPRATQDERALVRRLKSSVSDLIAARRDGLNAETSPSTVVLTALESSIRRRTTGPDGWKMA